MLRLLVLLLLLANGGYFAWSQGYLLPYGLAPVQQSEPQRVEQQLKPEAIRILAANEARRLEAAAAAPVPKPPECLQAGLFDEQQTTRLRQALESSLSANTWVLESAMEPARWIVYMGKYPNADAVNKKKAELRQLGVSFESLNNPTLEPGVSLGGFDTQAAANTELAALTRRGVRTAKVVQERNEVRGQRLRLPAVDDTLRARLDDLKTPLAGKPLRPCL